MRLATIKLHGAEVAGIVTGKGILPSPRSTPTRARAGRRT